MSESYVVRESCCRRNYYHFFLYVFN